MLKWFARAGQTENKQTLMLHIFLMLFFLCVFLLYFSDDVMHRLRRKGISTSIARWASPCFFMFTTLAMIMRPHNEQLWDGWGKQTIYALIIKCCALVRERALCIGNASPGNVCEIVNEVGDVWRGTFSIWRGVLSYSMSFALCRRLSRRGVQLACFFISVCASQIQYLHLLNTIIYWQCFTVSGPHGKKVSEKLLGAVSLGHPSLYLLHPMQYMYK